MAVDSKAVFSARVVELGLVEHVDRFSAAGWTTHASMAFSTGYAPGNTDEDMFAKEILIPGLGDSAHADRAKLRRLFIESYTLAAADLRRRVDTGSDDGPRRVPAIEREERRSRVAARLVGLDLKGGDWIVPPASSTS